MRRGILLSLGALIGGALAAVAIAGTDLGSAGGNSYRMTSTGVATGETVSLENDCPPAKAASGGGFQSSALGLVATAAMPKDGPDGDKRPDDRFRSTVVGETSDSFYAHAVCTGVNVTYDAEKKTVKAGKVGRLKAACPSGKSVIGGGASAGANQLTSSYPFDGRDRRARPDDGWAAISQAGEKVKLRVLAVCAGGKTVYEKETFMLPPGSSAPAIPDCPSARHVTGMGAHVTGNPAEIALRIFYHRDGDDPGSTPDDGVLANAENLPGASQAKTLTGFALCR
jgi:hypothetical protein